MNDLERFRADCDDLLALVQRQFDQLGQEICLRDGKLCRLHRYVEGSRHRLREAFDGASRRFGHVFSCFAERFLHFRLRSADCAVVETDEGGPIGIHTRTSSGRPGAQDPGPAETSTPNP